MLNPQIIEPIEKRLDHHPGRRSRVSVVILLAAILITAYRRRCYTVTAITETLGQMTPNEARWFGIDASELPDGPVSRHIVGRQLARLEQALAEGWTADGQTFDMEWFTTEMLRASVSSSAVNAISAVALDGTDFPSMATSPLNGTESSDPDARMGYRTSAGTRTEGMFFGYAVHIVVAVPEAVFRGVERKVTLGVSQPSFIVGLSVQPAGTNPADGGMAATMMARCVAPATAEVVADLPYTSQVKSFDRLLHLDGTNVVMDYPHRPLAQPKPPASLEGGAKQPLSPIDSDSPSTPDSGDSCRYVNVPVEQLDMFQRTPYGTQAWRSSIARILQAERAFGEIKIGGGLAAHSCPKLGLAAHSCPKPGLAAHQIAALAIVVARNLWIVHRQRNGVAARNAATGTPSQPHRRRIDSEERYIRGFDPDVQGVGTSGLAPRFTKTPTSDGSRPATPQTTDRFEADREQRDQDERSDREPDTLPNTQDDHSDNETA